MRYAKVLILLFIKIDDYFYNMIIQFGDKCECLEPEHVRMNLINRIENLLSIYKNVK